MPYVDLTDDEFEWVCIAIENARAGAVHISGEPNEEDAMDGIYLANKWAELSEKFPPPIIKLND